MHVVLWNTNRFDVSKDFAGGFGIGLYHGGQTLRSRVVRRFYRRDCRPVALVFPYLAAIFRAQGHTVEYVVDRDPPPADVYVFNPSLITLALERRVMQAIRHRHPSAKIVVTGIVAYTMPEAFEGLGVTIVRGEAEQLHTRLDEVLSSDDGTVVEVGSVADLDNLPFPDWSPFRPERFRIGYDFWKFPTALIQASRGCTFTCNYCPYIVVENATRFRDPACVAEEMRVGIERYGFRSFKFRDPLFGLDRKRVLRLADEIERLPRRIQFSIEGRIDLLRPETIRRLREAGLSSITVGIERPDEQTLVDHKRRPICDDRQREFVALCRSLGVRVVAGFMIGFPDDTAKTIRDVGSYARAVNPTFANFNVVTPYPGTEFFDQIRQQIATDDFERYDMYTPLLKYRHLTHEEVAELHSKCFVRYYFRWKWLRENAHLMWPVLQKLGVGRSTRSTRPAGQPAPTVGTAMADAAARQSAATAEREKGSLPVLQVIDRAACGRTTTAAEAGTDSAAAQVAEKDGRATEQREAVLRRSA